MFAATGLSVCCVYRPSNIHNLMFGSFRLSCSASSSTPSIEDRLWQGIKVHSFMKQPVSISVLFLCPFPSLPFLLFLAFFPIRSNCWCVVRVRPSLCPDKSHFCYTQHGLCPTRSRQCQAKSCGKVSQVCQAFFLWITSAALPPPSLSGHLEGLPCARNHFLRSHW